MKYYDIKLNHAVENHILKTIDNDLKHGLLSFRHLKCFSRLKKILQTLSFASCV